MRLRSRERYLSEEVDRFLRLIAKAWEVTPDEVADTLLKKSLLENYSCLSDYQKKRINLEEEFHSQIRECPIKFKKRTSGE